MLKVPGSNPAGSIKIAYFYRNFLFFYFFQKSNFWHKKLPPLKPILALPTWGQICLVSEIHPFEIKNFDLGHPVLLVRQTHFQGRTVIVRGYV